MTLTIPTIAYVAMILLAAQVARLICGRLRLPNVTGYVVIGAVLGGSYFKYFHPELRHLVLAPDVLEHFDVVSDLALGLVSFSIGAELEWAKLKKLGKSILAITIGEAMLAFVLVAGCLRPFFDNWGLPLILGAIASATAPAATVSVINQYRAKGVLTSHILAVVGIDDAVALVIFSFASTMAHVALGDGATSMALMILMPLIEIGLAFGTGIAMGLISAFFLKRCRTSEGMLFVSALAIIGTSALAALIAENIPHVHVSQLLAVMAMSAVVANRDRMLKQRIAQAISTFVPVLFAFFFILGGAHLDFTALPAIGMVGLVYLLARSTGKIAGATAGAVITKADPMVRKYIGFALIPQVGVAVALAYSVSKNFSTHQEVVSMAVNVLLFTTLITEIVGPLLTRYALLKSGEGRPEELGAEPSHKHA